MGKGGCQWSQRLLPAASPLVAALLIAFRHVPRREGIGFCFVVLLPPCYRTIRVFAELAMICTKGHRAHHTTAPK